MDTKTETIHDDTAQLLALLAVRTAPGNRWADPETHAMTKRAMVQRADMLAALHVADRAMSKSPDHCDDVTGEAKSDALRTIRDAIARAESTRG